MPASLCTLRDDGIHASSLHRLRVRHCGHHGDHLGASTMTLGHEVRIWAAHDNAEYRNALIQDDLQRAGDEVGWYGRARGDCREPKTRPHRVQGRLDGLDALIRRRL